MNSAAFLRIQNEVFLDVRVTKESEPGVCLLPAGGTSDRRGIIEEPPEVILGPYNPHPPLVLFLATQLVDKVPEGLLLLRNRLQGVKPLLRGERLQSLVP